ncbi:hypothetical protein XALC_0177 [Xanthomonas albilineans GPE PC73]|uniref:Uncharacterized protein n=2 Tax=Xanthomonas albilineans TaxID=29447 RepID=D2U8R7_XANAP|nr:hypothetical protein XALC_0177 [Xanthomonas albilineans GPE PC73]
MKTEAAAMMTIFQIDDMEWWIGIDAESVLKAVKDEYGHSDEDLKDFQEISQEALDRLMFQPANEDGKPIGSPHSFRIQIEIEIAKGGKFPRYFAGDF